MSKIYESDFEEAIVEKLKQEGWMHSRGDDINRGLDEALLTEDLRDYLATLPCFLLLQSRRYKGLLQTSEIQPQQQIT